MVYVLIYTENFGPQERVANVLDSIPEIEDWRCDIRRCFFIKSYLCARRLGKKISRAFPEKRFLLTRISDERWGWLPKKSWNLFREDGEE